MGLQRKTARFTAEQSDRFLKLGMGLAFFVTLVFAWEVFARVRPGLLIAPFSETVVAFVDLITSSEIYEALWITNQAMLVGFFAAIVSGIPLGLLAGRLWHLERFIDVYLSIMLVTPMAALIPLIIIALGLGLIARVFVVFIFAFPVIVVNTRAGLKNLDPTLIEMARSFGASEWELWRKIFLPGAIPAIMAGIRLGLGRSLSGMVVVELLLVAVGLGRLILNSFGLFRPEISYAVIIVIIIEVMIVMGVARRVEDRLVQWKPKP